MAAERRDAGPDMGVAGSFSPDGAQARHHRKAQPYWRKYYRGAYQSDVTIMDLATKTFKDLTTFDGIDSWPLWSKDGFIYFVSDREGKGAHQSLARARSRRRRRASHNTSPPATSASLAWATMARRWSSNTNSGSGSSTSPARRASPSRAGKSRRDPGTLTEFKDADFHRRRLRPSPPRASASSVSVHGDLFHRSHRRGRPPPAHRGRQRATATLPTPPDGKSIAVRPPTRADARRSTSLPRMAGRRRRSPTSTRSSRSYTWSPDSKTIAFHDVRGQAFHHRG